MKIFMKAVVLVLLMVVLGGLYGSPAVHATGADPKVKWYVAPFPVDPFPKVRFCGLYDPNYQNASHTDPIVLLNLFKTHVFANLVTAPEYQQQPAALKKMSDAWRLAQLVGYYKSYLNYAATIAENNHPIMPHLACQVASNMIFKMDEAIKLAREAEQIMSGTSLTKSDIDHFITGVQGEKGAIQDLKRILGNYTTGY